MKHHPDRRLIKSWPRFGSLAVQRFALFATFAGLLSGHAFAQISPSGKNSARSVSGLFIVTRPDQPSFLAHDPRTAAAADLVRLEPALLAVSAERIKDQLWRQLDIKGP